MKKNSSSPQSNETAFASFSEISICGKNYLVERHFTGNRNFQQAIFTAVVNEAKRDYHYWNPLESA
jgi:hypothetical protein